MNIKITLLIGEPYVIIWIFFLHLQKHSKFLQVADDILVRNKKKLKTLRSSFLNVLETFSKFPDYMESPYKSNWSFNFPLIIHLKTYLEIVPWFHHKRFHLHLCDVVFLCIIIKIGSFILKNNIFLCISIWYLLLVNYILLELILVITWRTNWKIEEVSIIEKIW